MYFKESAHLVKQHPALESLIHRVDELLSSFNVDARAQAEEMADYFNDNPNQVRAVLEQFVEANVLENVELVGCSFCEWRIDRDVYQEDQTDCTDCHQSLSLPLKIINAFRLTEEALGQVRSQKSKTKSPPNHVVLLLHGIRTDGVWQEMVAAELNRLPQVEAMPIGYEYLDVFRFWFPFTRKKPLRKILRKIRLAQSMHPSAEFSVIAHSFGTYSIFKILEENSELQFKRLILCGSIVSHEYPWPSVQPRISEVVVNECGSRDFWPAVAKSVSWGYGATGTFGFKSPGIRDRFHNLNHSGYFTEEFIRKFWVPFIDKGHVLDSDWNTKRPTSSHRIKLLSNTPIQWLLTIPIVLLVCYWLLLSLRLLP